MEQITHSVIFNATESVKYASDSVVSKTILKKESGTITLFAFDAGQSLSEHTAPFDAVVLILDGNAEITIAGHPYQLKKNDTIIMPGNIPHAVIAKEKFKMQLTMIKSQ